MSLFVEANLNIKVETLKITDESISFNEDLIISTYHSQDCCESVSGDFGSLVDLKDKIKTVKEINSVRIEAVENEGFVIFLNEGYRKLGLFVPCRNSQNGYYSNALSLNVSLNGVTTTIDLQDKGCVDNDEC